MMLLFVLLCFIGVIGPSSVDAQVAANDEPEAPTYSPYTSGPTFSPSPSISPTSSPTTFLPTTFFSTCPRYDDICEDEGASLIAEIDDAIKDLNDYLDIAPNLTQEEIELIEQLICDLETMKKELEVTIGALCADDGNASRLDVANCAEGDFDTEDLNKGLLAAKIVLAVAEAALATSELFDDIPFVGKAAIAVCIAARTAADIAVAVLEDEINKKDDDFNSCTQAYVQFLACPFTEKQQEDTVFIGQGCDGMDNNCNSVIGSPLLDDEKRVDECAEDQVPPSIDWKSSIPSGFTSTANAKAWFEDNIETSDDCVSMLETIIRDPEPVGGADPRLYKIDVRVFNPVCANDDEPGAFETKETFEFIVDDTGPAIQCGFDKRQDKFHVLDPNFVPDGTTPPPFPGGGRDDPLHINNEASLVDVKFWYNIADEAPGDRKIPVNVTVTSNELEDLGREMARIYKSRNLGQMNAADKVHRAEVYLAPNTCRDENHESLICKVEIAGDPELNTRFYDIEVTASDELGNIGKATCSVIVIPARHIYSGKSGKGPTSVHNRKTGEGSTATVREQDTDLYGHRRQLKDQQQLPSKGGKSGKGPSLEHDPNDLRDEFVLSTQRFQVAYMELEWDTSLDTTRDPPTTTPPNPKSGKSHKKTSKMSNISNGPIRRKLN